MMTIDQIIALSGTRFAEKPALRHKSATGWRDVTYGDLWKRVEALASGLYLWGMKPGDRVALLASPSPSWVVGYLATLRAGGIVVPIDKELKSAELRHILLDCGARVLFTENGFSETVIGIADDLPQLEKLVLLQGEEPAAVFRVKGIVAELEREWGRVAQKYGLLPEDARGMEELLAALNGVGGEAAQEGAGSFTRHDSVRRSTLEKLGITRMSVFSAPQGPLPSSRFPSDPAVLLYTSGTTGRSKGAVLSHTNILSNIQATASRFRVDSRIHTLSFLPINHVYEQVCGILLPLSLGGTVSFAESIKKLGPNLSEVRPNFLLGVPAVFRLLLDRLRRRIEERPLSRGFFAFPPTRPIIRAILRKLLGNPTFISGGAPLDPDVARGFRELGITIYQGYGITETSPVIAFECPGESRLGSVGRPLPGVEVRIDGAGEDEAGEIVVRGPNVMQGYFNNPQATAEVLADGWYRTGDLGRIDDEGYLYICGRKKNLIVTPNGKNVYPEEVEGELLKSPFIAEAMVYGHRVSSVVEEVHALIYPDQEGIDSYAARQGIAPLQQRDVEELIRREVLETGRRLADYKRVKKFTLREDEFPKTTTRKIKRFAVEAEISADF